MQFKNIDFSSWETFDQHLKSCKTDLAIFRALGIYRAYLEENFFYKKDLSEEEYKHLAQLISYERFTKLNKRYSNITRKVLGEWEKQTPEQITLREKLKEENELAGMGRIRFWMRDIEKSKTKTPNDPKTLYTLLRKTRVTEEMKAHYNEFTVAREKYKKRHQQKLANLRAQGIDPVMDEVIYELAEKAGSYHGQLFDIYKRFADALQKAIDEDNKKQLIYFEDEKQLQKIYSSYRRFYRKNKSNYPKEYWAHLDIIPKKVKKALTAKAQQKAIEKYSAKVNKAKAKDLHNPVRIEQPEDVKMVEATIATALNTLEKGSDDEVHDYYHFPVCYHKEGVEGLYCDLNLKYNRSHLDPHMRERLKRDEKNLKVRERLTTVLNRVLKDRNNWFICNNKDLFLYIPMKEFTKKGDNGVHFTWFEKEQVYRLNMAKTDCHVIAYLVEYR